MSRWAWASLCAALVLPRLAFAATSTSSAAPDGSDAAPDGSEWTREVRPEQEHDLDFANLALELPGSFLELAFVPLLPVIVPFERYHIAARLFDLFTNDEETLAVLPVVAPLNKSGTGFGGVLIYNDPLGSPDRILLNGLVRTNSDHNVGLSYGRRLQFLSGRTMFLHANYGVNHDEEFYDVEADQPLDDKRIYRQDEVNVETGLTLLSPDVPEWRGEVAVAYRYRDLSAGVGDDPSVGPDDAFADPAGFGKALHYPEGRIVVAYDSRDSVSRPSTGLLTKLEGAATYDLSSGQTSAFRGRFSLGHFFSLLPLGRVLLLTGGVAMAVPLGADHEVPLFEQVSLGGSDFLRGYKSNRFQGRAGWWGVAEYRYPFYEYGNTGQGLTAALFFDAGNVDQDLEDAFTHNFLWSAGLGIRAEHDLFLAGRLQVAYSPESIRVSLGFGELP